MIRLGDRRLLPVVRHVRDSLVRYLCSSSLGGSGHRWRITLCPRIALALINDELIGSVKDLVSLTSHGVRSGSDAVHSKWRSKRLEGKSEK
jgi:hypothetical protein